MNFLKITKCYGGDIGRNVESLSSIYDSPLRLREILLKTFTSEFLESVAGKSVLIKPNLVKHNLVAEDEICLRTNTNFILAALEIILEHAPKKVLIADAPIQGCIFEKFVNGELLGKLSSLSEKFGVEIKIKDFRRRTFVDAKVSAEKKPLSEYLIFDLKNESTLEEISSDGGIFRVNDYDYRRLAESHKKGVHKFCISKDVFDYDIILSMPKIKTHQKTGITCALKNLVGINGDKDYLPHHRVGGTNVGGDCYPGGNILRRASEFFLDAANSNQGKFWYYWLRLASRILWKLSRPNRMQNLGAAWSGNDTCWRMVMDLNKIALYGKPDSTISDSKKRVLYSLSDGIVGGQGDGPLYPKPLPLGIVMFTNSSYLNDVAVCKLFGFDMEKIPLIKKAFEYCDFENSEIEIDGRKVANLDELSGESIKVEPPPGWKDSLCGGKINLS